MLWLGAFCMKSIIVETCIPDKSLVPILNFNSCLCFLQMDPSLHDFESFLAKDVRKWVEKYDELKKYGPAIEAKNVTGRVLLEASANAIKEDLGMTALHADFLKGKVSKIMEGERWAYTWFFAVVMTRSTLEHCVWACTRRMHMVIAASRCMHVPLVAQKNKANAHCDCCDGLMCWSVFGLVPGVCSR